jgi:GH24 family phage-related lysozyme (muramidase)
MKLRLKSTPAARALIREYEPFRGSAERDANGRWTVGYGHRAGAREDTTVSRDDAELLMIYDVLQAEKAVDESINDPLQSPQRDALISFALGIGLTAFRQSAVVRLINKGRWRAAADAIAAWGGGDNPRHDAERALFMTDLPADISGRPVELVIEVEHPDLDEDDDAPVVEPDVEDVEAADEAPVEDPAEDIAETPAEDEAESEQAVETPVVEEEPAPQAAPLRPAAVPSASVRSAVAERVIARMRDQLAIREDQPAAAPVTARAEPEVEVAEPVPAPEPVTGPVGYVFAEAADIEPEEDETPVVVTPSDEIPPLTGAAVSAGATGEVAGAGPGSMADLEAESLNHGSDEGLPDPMEISPEFEAGSVVPKRNGWVNGDDSPAPSASGFPAGTVSVLGLGVLAFGVGVWDTASRWEAYSGGDIWPFGPATAAAGFVLTGAAAIGLISRGMRKN